MSDFDNDFGRDDGSFDDHDQPRQSFGPTYYDPNEDPEPLPDPSRTYSQTHPKPQVTKPTVETIKPSPAAIPTHPTIPNLFPRESVNLYIFTSKIGTFRFLLPQLHNYAAGLPVMEFAHPCPRSPEQLGMIFCNKQIQATRDKIESMGLDDLLTETSLPIVKWESSQKREKRAGTGRRYSASYDDDGPFPLDPLYDQLTVAAAGREPRFIIVDSIHLLLGTRQRMMDPAAVGDFTDRLHDFCRERHCTILGTIPLAKYHPGDEYQVLSHRIYGAVQWGVSISCLMMIERYNDTTTYRQIRIEASAGTNEKEMRWANFDDRGRLMLRPQPDGPRSPKKTVLDEFLADWEYDAQYTRRQALEEIQDRAKVDGTEVSRATVDRWLKTCVEVSRSLRKDGNGTYWKPKPD